MDFVKDIRIPGVLWALILIVVVALIHEYEAQLPLDPQVLDLIVLLIIGVIKSLNLGTAQLNQALDVIEEIRRTAGANRPRGTADAPSGLGPEVSTLAQQAPPRPNSMVRWLLG